MERTGEITAVHGEYLEITFCRPSDCEKCGACHGGQKQMKITLKGQGRVGDIAVVDMPMKTLMRASAIAYALPLAGLLIGMFAGATLFPAKQDMAGALGALIGLGISLGVVVLTERKRRQSSEWRPTLVEIIPKK